MPVDRVNECPPLFDWVNTSDSSGYCACASKLLTGIYCDQRNQVSSLVEGYCTFYDSKEDMVGTFWCPFLFPQHATSNGMFALPANVNELNSVVCGNLSREVKSPSCGRCINDTGPSVYSVGVECVSCSPTNVVYYIFLQYLPSTLISLLVIIFRPNITSGPMANYVLFCNLSVNYFRLHLWIFVKSHDAITNLAKTALTLSAVWSFDALLFVSPHLGISHHMEEFYTPLLELVATLYPFVLLLLTYAVIEMHTKNFGPIVKMWRLVRRPYVQVYRAWDPTSSMIKAFASLSYLSFAKLSYLIWEAFQMSEVRSNTRYADTRLLHIDPNVPYGSNKHVLLMTFSVAVAVFVFLPPVLILVVYPTSLYRKISHWISPKWRLRIKTYVETFNGCFKDGTNGTRDYRSLPGWGLLLSCPFLGLLISIIAIIHGPLKNTLAYYIVAIFVGVIAFFCIWQQPYKDRNSNTLTGGLLILVILVSLLATGAVHSPERENNAKVFMIILLLVPHIVLWSYVIWRVLKTITSHCYRCQNEAREGLLHHCSEQMN